MTQITVKSALATLEQKEVAFTELFQHGSLTVECYRPHVVDEQQPHARDEVYVVISGSGMFFNDGISLPFSAGDVLFVPAAKEHRFVDFTDDFATWVFFYEPDGGEHNE